MIRVDRGEEPAALTTARASALKSVLPEYRRRGASKLLKSKLDAGYDGGRRELWERQQHKCAYCERPVGLEGTPIDHFRPKKQARRDGEVDPERYWWLTWTWANLFLVCATCNSVAHKGDHFPLRENTAAMPTPSRSASSPEAWWFDTSSESPLLVDPGDPAADPLDHMRWLPVDRAQARPNWRWKLTPLTIEGRRTVKQLGLDKMADDITHHYRGVFREFHDKVEVRVRDRHVNKWTKLCNDLLATNNPYLAATWSMLDLLRDSSQALRNAGLAEPPRPGAKR